MTTTHDNITYKILDTIKGELARKASWPVSDLIGNPTHWYFTMVHPIKSSWLTITLETTILTIMPNYMKSLAVVEKYDISDPNTNVINRIQQICSEQ